MDARRGNRPLLKIIKGFEVLDSKTSLSI